MYVIYQRRYFYSNQGSIFILVNETIFISYFKKKLSPILYLLKFLLDGLRLSKRMGFTTETRNGIPSTSGSVDPAFALLRGHKSLTHDGDPQTIIIAIIIRVYLTIPCIYCGRSGFQWL